MRLWNLSDFTKDKEAKSRESNGGYNLPHHVLKGHKETVTCLKFCADGLLLASGSHDTHVFIWNVSTQRPTLNAKFKAHEAWVRSLCWTQDQQILASASTDGLITCWSVPKKYHIVVESRGKYVA